MNNLSSLFSLFCCLFSLSFVQAQDRTLSSQAEVDAWDPNETVLTGDVLISATTSTITNLEALSVLTEIQGTLSIYNSNELNNIDGLRNVTSITGTLHILAPNIANVDGLRNLSSLTGTLNLSNNWMTNIDSLIGLTSIPGTLRISGTQITDLNGLQNVQTITGHLNLYQTDIINLEGISQLTVLDGDLSINSPGFIEDLESLSNLTEIRGNLSLSRFYSLNSIDGLRNVTSITGALYISSNSALKNIDGLSQLTTLDGELTLSYNGLTNIEGLKNLTLINTDGKLELSVNSLTTINGLRNLASLKGELIIKTESITSMAPLANLTNLEGTLSIDVMRNMPDLDGLTGLSTLEGNLILTRTFATSMTGLRNLESINGSLVIEDANGLLNLDDLSNLKSLEGDLRLESNRALINIDGLKGVTSLQGKIEILKNDVLDNIDGFENVTSLTGTMNIGSNEALRHIDGLSGLESIPNDLTIYQNGIETIHGLRNITNISGDLDLSNNYNLTDLKGLKGLDTISSSGFVEISYNDGLLGVDGLVNLSTVDGGLYIHRNLTLNNINGLRNLESGDGRVDINYNNELTDCCGVKRQLALGSQKIFVANGIGCRSKLEVLSTPCDIDNFTANVFVDENDNCLRENDESGLGNITVNIGDEIYQASNNDGLVSAILLPGEYQINAYLRPDLFSSCRNDFPIEIQAEEELHVDIPVKILDECADLSFGISTPFLRRCFDNTYTIELVNMGSVIADQVNLVVELDEFFEYLGSDMELISQNGKVLIFDVGDIDRGHTERFKLDIHLSCDAEPGQQHYLRGHLAYANPCNKNIRVQTSFECRQNIGSFDPNDKTAFVDGFANKEILGEGELLEYLVRFQNTGTDTAFTVRIEDDLVPALDRKNLYPFAASHDYTWEIDRGKLTVLFEKINLPDSTTNEMGSHGFVKFRALVDEAETDPGTLIQNEASIYFDFNSPIVTNTTSTHYLCKHSQEPRETVYICTGDSYLLDGKELTDPGFYTAEMTTEMGCDSIVSIWLRHTSSSGLDEIPYNGIDDDCNSLTPDDDLDNDGFALADDCDDNNASVHPNQTEGPYNGVDDDCDPSTPDDDLDEDGYLLADDCDDTTAVINPDQQEIPYNGLDDDCEVETKDDDLDGDGYNLADDCDDDDASISPAAVEIVYNGIDEDCNPETRDDDLDGDGFNLADDCDDDDASISPGTAEVPYNGIDEDCNPETLDDDLDQDGFILVDDCDDENPLINPDAIDLPDNMIDEDCNGVDSMTTIVHELPGATINIYPNPAVDVINIEVIGSLFYELNLYDLNGKLIKSVLNSDKFPIEEIATGTYLMELKEQGTGLRIVEKIIIWK